MVISPHADDASAFCGATLARLTGQGWKVVLVRVTDDCKDSLGLTIKETIQKNTEQLHIAAQILGIQEIVELGFESDTLADIPLGTLREHIVYLFRKYKPHTVFSFDPHGLYENNQDHVRVAQAVDEAFWVACFDKHYPAHFLEGLEPFSVCERWYFGRHLPEITCYEDISLTIEKKIEAICAHREMMRNTIQQYRFQLQTSGRRLAILDEALDGNPQSLIGLVMQEQARSLAIQAGWDGETIRAEAFRMVRFGELEPLFNAMADPLEPGDEAEGLAET
jgi:LmbE family N-acetylglucosaminyl deacetylase